MKIVELSDYSMVIMKDSDDPPWISAGSYYRSAQERGVPIIVERDTNYYETKPIRPPVYQKSSEAVYTAGRLVLFFSDPVDPDFQLYDKVNLY